MEDEELFLYDIEQYTFENLPDDSLIAIYSKDDFQDNPTNRYFRLTCFEDTYVWVKDALEGAVRIDLESPSGNNDGIYTQIQWFNELGESECIVVGEIRLPNGVTQITNDQEIAALAEFVDRIEKQK